MFVKTYCIVGLWPLFREGYRVPVPTHAVLHPHFFPSRLFSSSPIWQLLQNFSNLGMSQYDQRLNFRKPTLFSLVVFSRSNFLDQSIFSRKSWGSAAKVALYRRSLFWRAIPFYGLPNIWILISWNSNCWVCCRCCA